MTIREVLKSAFAPLFEMEELGTIQDLLMAHDFYVIDSKVEEVGRDLQFHQLILEDSLLLLQ